MTHVIMAFALEAQDTVAPDGLQRASVWIPAKAVILHLGTVPQTQVIAIYALTPLPPRAADGTELPYDRKDLRQMEFIVATVGSKVPPKGYKMRAPVRTKDENEQEGLIFLFEKEQLLVVGGY